MIYISHSIYIFHVLYIFHMTYRFARDINKIRKDIIDSWARSRKTFRNPTMARLRLTFCSLFSPVWNPRYWNIILTTLLNDNPPQFLVWTQKKGVFLFPHHSLLCADQLLFCWRKHVSFLCFLLWVIYVYFIYIFFNQFYVFSMMYYLWSYYIHFQFLKSQVRQEFLPSLVCSVYYDTFAGWVKIYKHMGECKYYHHYLLNVHITYLYPFLTIFIYCVKIKLK